MGKFTDDEYTEMAADYEANPPGADEIVGPIEVNPELRALIDEAVRDAEAVQDLPDDGAPLPPHVTVSRPNQRVYINDDDIDLDTEIVIVDGERLTNERADAIANEVAARVRESGLVRVDDTVGRRRRTDAEYAEMAADYEANPIRADEILSVHVRRPDGTYEDMTRDIESGNYAVRGPAEMGSELRDGRPAE